ncbi:hypothetical protein BAUCODRAFT_49270, partial [Baudoinia panamericana UAMH 10762]
LTSFGTSPQAYLRDHPDPRYKYIAVSAIVFDTINPSSPRILLVQRAASDSMPNQWEVPGGGCDEDDHTILHSAARELWEETGLKAKRILSLVGSPHIFTSSSGKAVIKFNFLVEAHRTDEGGFEVSLDPKEHQRFLWATEDEACLG